MAEYEIIKTGEQVRKETESNAVRCPACGNAKGLLGTFHTETRRANIFSLGRRVRVSTYTCFEHHGGCGAVFRTTKEVGR